MESREHRNVVSNMILPVIFIIKSINFASAPPQPMNNNQALTRVDEKTYRRDCGGASIQSKIIHNQGDHSHNWRYYDQT